MIKIQSIYHASILFLLLLLFLVFLLQFVIAITVYLEIGPGKMFKNEQKAEGKELVPYWIVNIDMSTLFLLTILGIIYYTKYSRIVLLFSIIVAILYFSQIYFDIKVLKFESAIGQRNHLIIKFFKLMPLLIVSVRQIGLKRKGCRTGLISCWRQFIKDYFSSVYTSHVLWAVISYICYSMGAVFLMHWTLFTIGLPRMFLTYLFWCGIPTLIFLFLGRKAWKRFRAIKSQQHSTT